MRPCQKKKKSRVTNPHPSTHMHTFIKLDTRTSLNTLVDISYLTHQDDRIKKSHEKRCQQKLYSSWAWWCPLTLPNIWGAEAGGLPEPTKLHPGVWNRLVHNKNLSLILIIYNAYFLIDVTYSNLHFGFLHFVFYMVFYLSTGNTKISSSIIVITF